MAFPPPIQDERVVGVLVGDEVSGPDGTTVRVQVLAVEDLGEEGLRRRRQALVEGQEDDLHQGVKHVK